MKIAYVLQDFPRLSETFVLREIRELQRRGHRIAVFALRDPGETCRHGNGVDAVGADLTYASSLPAAERCRAFFRYVRQRPVACGRVVLALLRDTVRHPRAFAATWRWLPVAFAFARRIESRGIPHVHAHFAGLPADIARIVDIVTDGVVTVAAHAWDIHGQSGDVLRRRLHGARAVVTCSRDGHTALAGKVTNGTPLHRIPHGLPLERFAAAPAPPDPGPPRILAVGRLVPKKGFADLVAACALLRDRDIDVRCEIVGEGPERDRLERAIATAELADAVTLSGALPQDEVASRYAAATLVVHPAVQTGVGDREGIPNVVLEAMATRRPVVATRSGGIPEVVRNGITGKLVAPRDPNALADAIASLLNDPERRTVLAQAGHRHVKAAYDIVTNVGKLDALFLAVQKNAKT